MNKIMLIGNLGRAPEMSYTPGGVPFTKFSLAVNRVTGSTANNDRRVETDWFNIVTWNKLAETCNSYLQKGSKVYIEGRLSQRKYTDKNGQERTAIEVVANEMEILTPKNQQDSASSSNDFLLDEPGNLDDHPF
jgi:single-strand DNA-binding protein